MAKSVVVDVDNINAMITVYSFPLYLITFPMTIYLVTFNLGCYISTGLYIKLLYPLYHSLLAVDLKKLKEQNSGVFAWKRAANNQ